MKPKTTIILAALLLVCVVLALFTGDVFRSGKPKEEKAGKEQGVFEPAFGKVVQLTVEGRGGKVAFARTDDVWRITEPLDAKAEAWRVNDIADALKDLKGRPTAEGNDTTGLDQPIWTVTAVDDKNVTHRLLIGRSRPLNKDQTYVRPADGKQTFIASVVFADKLDKPVSDFRDTNVLDLKTDKIVALSVQGKESYELVKRDGKWGIVKPVSAAADEEKVRSLLDKAARVTASEFVSDAPKGLAPYGLDTPRLLVTVEMEPEQPASASAATQPTQPAKPGKKHTLLVGKQVGDKLYAKLGGEPTILKVPQSLMADLQPKLTDLRVKTVLRLTADEVAGVDLELPAGKGTLARKDGEWRMIAPLAGKADEKAVKALLDAAAALKADSFEDDPAAPGLRGLDSPAAKVTFQLAGKGEAVTLLIGGKSFSGEVTFVKAASALAVAVVKTADLKDLLAEPATYWDRAILKLPPGAKITRLQLRRPDETFTVQRDANDAWRLTTPLAVAADKDQMNKIIDYAEKLEADKIVYLGKTVPDQYAKSETIMQVEVRAEAPPATQPTTQATQPTQPATTQPATTQPAGTQPAATRPGATQPAATQPTTKPVTSTHQVTIAKVGLHSYAWRSGAEVLAVGEFAPSLYDDLAGELRDRKVWKLQADAIRRIRLTAGADSLELRSDGKEWTYVPDPYVKVDAEKVQNYLKDLQELTVQKFTTHAATTEPAKYGLDKPWLRLELTDQSGATSTLALANEGATRNEDRYGQASTQVGVFLMPASSLTKITKTINDLKK